jgi:hypothetical protein
LILVKPAEFKTRDPDGLISLDGGGGGKAYYLQLSIIE